MVRRNVGVGRDDLLFGIEREVLLEFEIAERAREGEVAVDAAEFDKAAGGSDTLRLLCTLVWSGFTFTIARRSGTAERIHGRRTPVGRLVVKGERLGLALVAQHCTRVTRVCLCHQHPLVRPDDYVVIQHPRL